ncbi:preprotein translocase subunit SecY [Candidatus Saccharibacteria bacterium]|nr:preprotein translocase subunit SecY [Candidatus Saccharibacteria bacterium]MBP9551932.1 preprotein translocase subunit SecY [Candidatus Saccharibacteria bacterium]
MNWKTVFKSLKNKDMRDRFIGVIALIVIYRFLAHIPVPLAEPTQFKDVVSSAINSTDIGGFMNLLSGGALTSFSIMLVGLSPFITASIISQLMTKAIPSLEELSNDGETGRRKINQWTRRIAVPLAVLQSIAYIFILRQTVLAGNTTILDQTTPIEWVVAVTAMSAGSILLMWIGELITEKGISNGISLVIFAGIVSQLPTTLATIISSITDTSSGALSLFGWFTLQVSPLGTGILLATVFGGIIALYLLVKINESQRIITINYAKRVHGNSSYGGIKSILPIKLIAAGVVPVIFAVSFLSLPAFVGQLLKSSGNEAYSALSNNLVTWFQAPNAGAFTGETWEAFIYPVIYFLLIVMFTFFYTSIVFNSSEIADNLQKQGGFIEGVRPGKTTEKYLDKIVNRLNLFGAIALGLIAIMPFVADYLLYHIAGVQNSNLSIGGTGLLIVVTVALESLRQLNSRALMVTYDEYK